MKSLRLLSSLPLALTLFALQPLQVSVQHADAAGAIYNKSGKCLNYLTSLPSVAGAGYQVFSPKTAASAAKTVAGVIRSHDVFGVYAHGLGLPSLNQSGQAGPFPVFVDPALPSEMGEAVDGIASHLCQHPDWGAVAIYPNLPGDELAATVYHELFHAAQAAVLRSARFTDNWWYEATATAAEAWFGSRQHKDYDPTVVGSPATPMDTFDRLAQGGHQYGAYLFVQWALQSAGMPDVAQWSFLRKSILDAYSRKPDWDAGLNVALPTLPTRTSCDPGIPRLACDVASFWGDEITPHPSFAKTAFFKKIPIDPEESEFTLPSPDLLGARTVALTPGRDQKQVELVVPTFPAGVEVWIYLGDKKLESVRPGQRFDKTFCVAGQTDDSLPMPETGDIRIAMTTTDRDGAHKAIDFKTVSSTGECGASNGIIVLQQSVNGGQTPAAAFKALTCKVTKSKTGKTFQSTGKSGAYTLQVSIKHFNGYKDYALQFQSTDPAFVVKGPGGPFSNLYWPGGTPPNVGGYITFPKQTIMGLGFINAFNAGASDSIAVAGTAPCNLGTV